MTRFQAPTGAQIEAVLRRIPTPELRRAFFEGLKNPLWVEPLAKIGMFDNPPEPEHTSDGLIRETYWPEADYLTRVAPAAPHAVVDVLLKLERSNNSWVRRAAFAIGSTIPADEAARLKPLLKSWSARGFGWRNDPREMVSLAVNLLQGGQEDTGRWFAGLLFRPTASATSRTPTTALEDFWYEDGLPRVVEAMGDDGLRTVLPWLVEYERDADNLSDSFDMTGMFRESIRSVEEPRYPSVEHALIDAVRDLAIRAMLSDPVRARATLTDGRMVLTQRIGLHAAAEAIKGTGQGAAEAETLLRVAVEFLFSDESRDDSCRIEFGELAREVAKHSPALLEPMADFIAAGPPVGLDVLRERLQRDDEDSPAETELRVQAVLDNWKHQWLAAVGLESLPPALKPILAELDARLGVIESPLAPSMRSWSWSGPNSPITQDEMSAMSPAELAAHLESWHDAGDGWGPAPSHNGQGRELTAVMATKPGALAGVDDLILRLRPTYLRAILEGWQAAVKSDLDLDWIQVGDLIRDVLSHGDMSSFPVEGRNGDDDVDFRWAKKAAVYLLSELVKKRETASIPHDSVAAYADLLIHSAADETAWDEYDSADQASGMDPLTLSLNEQWAIRMRGLLNLMAHGTSAAWYVAARDALEHEIGRPDRRGASRAVIGEGLGRLVTVDPDWLLPRLADLFGTPQGISRNQQIALTTALAIHHYNRTLYEMLSPSLIAAITSGEPLVAGWRGQDDPLQRIGEWVVGAIIWGHKTTSDPVAEKFFAVTNPKVRGKAIGHIAWSFMHAETVDDAIRDRLANLWDERVDHVRSHPEDKQELDGFHWFVKSGKFDASWWLPRLKEAVELDPELAGERFMIGKEIAASAEADPRGALDAVKVLLTERGDSGVSIWDLSENAVPIVLARAISSGDEDLKQTAIILMNELGEKGYRRLEEQVSDALGDVLAPDNEND